MAYTDTIGKVIGITCSTVTALSTEVAIAVSDSSLDKASGASHINAGGKRKPYATKPGAAEATGSMEFILTPDTAALLDLGLDETLHTFTYNEGLDGNKATCKATSVKVSGEFSEVVTVSIDFTASAVTTGTAIVASADIATPYICLGATLETGGSAEFESFELGADNNLEAIHGMRGASRMPVHLAPGYQTLTFGVNFLEDPVIDPLANALATEGTEGAEIELIIGQAAGAATAPSITFKLEDLRPADLSTKIATENIIRYDASYIAKEISYELTAA